MDVVGTFKVNMGAGASHILAILTIWGPLGGTLPLRKDVKIKYFLCPINSSRWLLQTIPEVAGSD